MSLLWLLVFKCFVRLFPQRPFRNGLFIAASAFPWGTYPRIGGKIHSKWQVPQCDFYGWSWHFDSCRHSRLQKVSCPLPLTKSSSSGPIWAIWNNYLYLGMYRWNELVASRSCDRWNAIDVIKKNAQGWKSWLIWRRYLKNLHRILLL